MKVKCEMRKCEAITQQKIGNDAMQFPQQFNKGFNQITQMPMTLTANGGHFCIRCILLSSCASGPFYLTAKMLLLQITKQYPCCTVDKLQQLPKVK